MRVAVQGCLHGQLADVYKHIEQMQRNLQIKFDALIVCGDFQSLRHQGDMEDMHCPQKYKNMGCFRDYYESKKIAPVLTILIGGNHEAVNSLRQSHFGGWLAPNFYFLGQAGSIFLCKGKQRIRITGCSGIYNQADFKYCTRVERYPLYGKDRITAYHQKQIDIYRMELLARITTMKRQKPQIYGTEDSTFDIMLSHDWPKDIALYGDTKQLYRYKPFLKNQIDNGVFGNWPMLRILQNAKPSYWFSAHMHVKYSAIYPHGLNYFTHFLSLDKCLGKRSCLQLLTFKTDKTKNINQHPQNKEQQIQKQHHLQQKQEQINNTVRIEVDSTWIGVLLLTHELMQGSDNLYYLQKQQVKLVDVNKMNDLIKLYPTIINQLSKIGKYSFNPDISQTEQTKHFLSTIGIDLCKLQGICFQKKSVQYQYHVEDQIDLDL